MAIESYLLKFDGGESINRKTKITNTFQPSWKTLKRKVLQVLDHRKIFFKICPILIILFILSQWKRYFKSFYVLSVDQKYNFNLFLAQEIQNKKKELISHFEWQHTSLILFPSSEIFHSLLTNSKRRKINVF